MNSGKFYIAVCALVTSVFLTACQSGPAPVSSTNSPEITTTTRAPQVYVLGSGDQLRVNVFGQPDLSGLFEVDGTGEISLPLIGEVQALGQSTRALEQEITSMLADGYLNDPKVSIEVANYRPFYVLGEVGAPGEYPYNSGLTVLNAVASAGGFTYRANKKVVYIRSFEGTDEVAVRLDSTVQVQPGDTLRIGERLF